jgi:hypothetical protein
MRKSGCRRTRKLGCRSTHDRPESQRIYRCWVKIRDLRDGSERRADALKSLIELLAEATVRGICEDELAHRVRRGHRQ